MDSSSVSFTLSLYVGVHVFYNICGCDFFVSSSKFFTFKSKNLLLIC
jgi:hypothetical protein